MTLLPSEHSMDNFLGFALELITVTSSLKESILSCYTDRMRRVRSSWRWLHSPTGE